MAVITEYFKLYFNSGRMARARWNERRYERRSYMEESEDYYEAFGKQICILLKREKGKIPFPFDSMSKSRAGLVQMGKAADKQLREHDDPNYQMLRFMAEQDVEMKNKGDAAHI